MRWVGARLWSVGDCERYVNRSDSRRQIWCGIQVRWQMTYDLSKKTAYDKDIELVGRVMTEIVISSYSRLPLQWYVLRIIDARIHQSTNASDLCSIF